MSLKYRIPLAIISILMVMTLFLASSYALWKVTIYQETENLIDSGCFAITFEEETESINLTNTYPMPNENGMKTNPYIFTITNTCTVDAKYTLYLNTLEVSGNKISDELIDYAIVKENGAIAVANKLSTAKKNIDTSHFNLGKNIITSYEVGTGTLKGASSEGATDGGSATYSLRLWIDESATTAINGYSFEAGLSVISTATKLETAYLNDYITSLAESSEDLAYDGTVDNNLRYIGADPNNYVLFNNELWRIIGVMNNIKDSNGNKGSHVKIIRNESIGTYSWDNKGTNGSNDWTDSSLMKVLNNGAYWNRTSGSCPYGGNEATTPCNFSSNGLSNEVKSMISNVVWNLGGNELVDHTEGASSYYTIERGNTVYIGHAITWTGMIGLIYPSDFGYAVGGSVRNTCLSTILNDYNINNCNTNDWLHNSSDQLTLTPGRTNDNYVYYVGNYGYLSDTDAFNKMDTRPTLYLNSNVEITGGDGSQENPFTLS